MADAPDGVRKGGRYLSFLLRIWQKNGINTQWLASLESAGSYQRIGFPSLEALFEYLRQKTGEQKSANGETGEEEVMKIS